MALWSAQVAHAVEHRQDVTHGGAGNPRAVPEPRLLAIPGACGLGRGIAACPNVSSCSGCAMLVDAVSRPPELGVLAATAGATGNWRVAVRGPSAAGANPGELCWAPGPPSSTRHWRCSRRGRRLLVREFAIITDNPAGGYVTPSFSLMSARRMCFWTLPVAVMGRADDDLEALRQLLRREPSAHGDSP